MIWSASVHPSNTNPCQEKGCQVLFWLLTEFSPLPNKHALKYSQHYLDLKTLPCHQAENVLWFLYGTLKPGRKINHTYCPPHSPLPCEKAKWEPLSLSLAWKWEGFISISSFEMHLKFQLLSSNIRQGHIFWKLNSCEIQHFLPIMRPADIGKGTVKSILPFQRYLSRKRKS